MNQPIQLSVDRWLDLRNYLRDDAQGWDLHSLITRLCDPLSGFGPDRMLCLTIGLSPVELREVSEAARAAGWVIFGALPVVEGRAVTYDEFNARMAVDTPPIDYLGAQFADAVRGPAPESGPEPGLQTRQEGAVAGNTYAYSPHHGVQLTYLDPADTGREVDTWESLPFGHRIE